MSHEHVADPNDPFGAEPNLHDDEAFLSGASVDDPALNEAGELPPKKKIPAWVFAVGFVVLAGAGGFAMSVVKGQKQGGGGSDIPNLSTPSTQGQAWPSSPIAQPPVAQLPVQPGVGAPADIAANPASPQPVMPGGANPVTPQPMAVANTIPAQNPGPTPGTPPAQAAPASPPIAAGAPGTTRPAPVTLAAAPPEKVTAEVADLRQRVADLETKVSALTPRPTRAAPRVAASTHTETPRKMPSAKRKPAPAESTASTADSKSSSHSTLRLRNITEGQAWIDDAEGRTTVVAVGDTVAGARITKIIPEAYRVETDRGTVTFPRQ